jgi:hypothetical protein
VDSVGSGWGPVPGSCEHSDELSGSCATELVCRTFETNRSLVPEAATPGSYSGRARCCRGSSGSYCEHGNELRFP